MDVTLLELGIALKRAFPQRRGRREIDVEVEVLRGINRANLTGNQRRKTPTEKERGRPKNPDASRVVKLVQELRSQGYTLTYTPVRLGTAFEEAARQLLEKTGRYYSPGAVRGIWSRCKKIIY